MSSEGNVSLMRIALNRELKQNLCHRKGDSLASPEASDIRLPSVHRNCCAESYVAPCVSNISDWKIKSDGRLAYLEVFLSAAASAAAPADWDDRRTYESARVLIL